MPMRIPILYRSKGHYMLHIFYFEVKAKRKGEHAQVLISPHHSASTASIRSLKSGFRTDFDAHQVPIKGLLTHSQKGHKQLPV